MLIPRRLDPLTPAESAAVTDHLDLIDKVVSRLTPKLPTFVEADDLKSAGVTGLVKALRRFDPAKKVKFATYAQLRIHGEILDYLRNTDPVPRSVRRRCAARGEEPPKTVSLSAGIYRSEDADAEVVELTNTLEARPETRHDDEDLWAYIEAELGTSAGWFIRERYQKERKHKDIGIELGLTESRMCQIDKALRARLQERGILEQAGWFKNLTEESMSEDTITESTRYPPDFRVSSVQASDAELKGTWYRCRHHGLLQNPHVIGNWVYCTNSTCTSAVILAHADASGPGEVVRDGRMTDPERRRKGTAVIQSSTGRPRAVEVIVEVLKKHDEPVRAHVLIEACVAAGFARGGCATAVSSAVENGHVECVGTGLYRLGSNPVSKATGRWARKTGPRAPKRKPKPPVTKPDTPMPFEGDTMSHEAAPAAPVAPRQSSPPADVVTLEVTCRGDRFAMTGPLALVRQLLDAWITGLNLA